MNTEMHDPIRTDWRHTPLSRMPKRVSEGGKLGGVVAGVSHAFGFDLKSTRIATAVALLVLPPLWLVYLAAWVLLPASPEEAASIDSLLHDRQRRPLLVVMAAVAVLSVAGVLGSWFFFQGAPWGVILIGFGVLLWVSTTTTFTERAGARHTAPAPSPTVPTPITAPIATPAPAVLLTDPPTAPTPVTAPLAGPLAGSFPAPQPPLVDTPVEPRPTTPRRPRRPITSIGVGITTLWFLVVGVGNALDWWKVPNLWVVVTGIAIVLAAMVVSIVVNRSWVLPFLFGPLAAVLLGLCIAQPDIDGPSGQRTVVPSTPSEATVRQHLSTGPLTLDLRDVPMDGQTIAVDAEVGMGRLHVTVPDDVDLVLRTDVGMGQAQFDGQEIASGVRQTNVRTVTADSAPTTGTMELDLRVGMGQIDVTVVASGS